MRIDSSRKDEQTFGIDDLPARCREVLTDLGNDPVLHPDVTDEAATFSDNFPLANHEIAALLRLHLKSDRGGSEEHARRHPRHAWSRHVSLPELSSSE